MKYGCIGEHLKHSFSKEIHNTLSDYEYEIKEIEKDRLGDFAREADFKAINVTIPYKEQIMPYLHQIDEHARLIGAVNTVVNREGKLYGYNTDFYGMRELLHHAKIDVFGKKVAILGSGGTAKTALAVCKSEGASEMIRVSRTKKEGSASYEELYRDHADTQVIINTTPVGMYPNVFDTPIELSGFKRLVGVIDAIYNPLCSPLVLKAQKMGAVAEGGLYMLVAQAVRASEIFIDTKYPEGTTEKIYEKIFKEKQSIVLIGMPSSGKSTVGRILAKRLGRTFFDTDVLIEENEGMSISEIFERYGERGFRDIECAAVRAVADKTSAVIATGGGVILKKENLDALRENGKLIFIDRPLSQLIPTPDRPLSSTAEAVTKRYNERIDIYKSSANIIIDADCDEYCVADRICEALML